MAEKPFDKKYLELKRKELGEYFKSEIAVLKTIQDSGTYRHFLKQLFKRIPENIRTNFNPYGGYREIVLSQEERKGLKEDYIIVAKDELERLIPGPKERDFFAQKSFGANLE